ncbi:hypothetical protein [Pseudoxanthomonas winnipegensis]|uniref:HPt domain-containing protein n=1 Tax=Pseudoxanthomonas winnipegensis TaxID=2480810 RepID=A0A4Q8LAP8_9GAMM|nr:hypothetical protein [Pseudoxanthomonas winnipegensis]TAA25434.1 hypothetical protein EA660_08215 [Pseudoxanthomonas winnipegensis]
MSTYDLNTQTANLQADDLSILLSRLDDVPELIESGRMKQARDDLGLIKGLARAAELAAERASGWAQSVGDKAHHEALGGQASAVARLVRNALLKIDQGRATAAKADVDSAIELAQEMVEAAERFAQVAP